MIRKYYNSYEKLERTVELISVDSKNMATVKILEGPGLDSQFVIPIERLYI